MASTQASTDVPIFLRKTFLMIDSCDEKIASWSDDGLTFTVKDPSKFEKTVIPQFFKHSKFTSFVRQLNFYSFRKIKNSDSLRIDPAMEKLTANYWRFRHENFRRGRPDLLTEIKRSNHQKAQVTKKASAPTSEVDTSTKSEVQTLKKRIEEMTRNIDELTAMVQSVSLKQEEQAMPFAQDRVPVGSKRVKFDDDVRPDAFLSNMELEDIIIPDVPSSDNLKTNQVLSGDDLDAVVLPDTPLSSSPKRQASDSTAESDGAFVDQLFNAFNNEDEIMQSAPEPSKNSVDPELMQRLSDTLATLPKEMQNIIVDRLIAAILSVESVDMSNVVPVAPEPTKVPATPDTEKLPIAAASLAALLHHYGSQQQKTPKTVRKSIPVIPVHA